MAGYGDDLGFAGWLSAQGLTLPLGAQLPAVLRQIGSAWLDAAYELSLSCSQRTGGWMQELAWPRTAHRVNGQLLPDDLIPAAWVNASYRAAWLEGNSPGWATGSADPNRITRREQVDVISREFFAPSDSGGAASAAGIATDAIINGMVLPLLCSKTRQADSLFRVI